MLENLIHLLLNVLSLCFIGFLSLNLLLVLYRLPNVISYCCIKQMLMSVLLTMEGVTTTVQTLLVALSAVATPAIHWMWIGVLA